MSWLLGRNHVHGRKILSCKAFVLLSRLVEKHAVTIVADFVAQIRGAVFGRAELRSVVMLV